MRRRPYIFVSICMFISSNAGISILASEFAQSIRSIHLTDPIRMTELDNSNFGLKPLENFPYPLIYPSEFSLFKLIDYGDPSFQSLDILAKFPAKDNFTGRNYHKVPLNGKNPLKFPVDDKSNLFEQVDPVIQFVQTGPVKSLSTDDELKSFLNNKNKKKSEDFNSLESNPSLLDSGKRFSDFRSEVESSLASRIFKQKTRNIFVPQEKSRDQIVSNEQRTKKTSQLPIYSQDKDPKNVLPSTLKLRARKPNNNGQLEPAQASEFYLTTQNLNELLQNLEAEQAVEGELKSVAEIWAKAEKNASQAPEVALGVKSILLQAKVSKARTDPYGEAALRGVQPDEKYFLIGIDKDVLSNVVTIWSKEVAVQPGENLVELSSSDVIYQE